jgi:DNA repair protein RadC
MKQAQIVSELKIAYIPKVKAKDRKKITNSSNLYEAFKPFYDEYINYKELFFVAYLNKANKLLGIMKISEGGLCATLVDIRIIIQGLVLCNATQIILSHNHPTGNLQPSQADIDITNKIKSGFKFMDIIVLDHIIITEDGYYSFADNDNI